MILRTLIASLLAATALPQEQAAPPPPIGPRPAVPDLVDLVPGEAMCDGTPVAFTHLERPFPISAFGSASDAPESFTLRFRIDASGRPLDIERSDATSGGPVRSLYYLGNGIAPAFASSRFAPQARGNCTIRFEARRFAAAEAPLPLVMRYFVAPHARHPGEQALFRRMHPADTNCIGAGSPKLRMRALPAFEDIAIAPGGWAYAMTAFDIDAKGRPVNVRIIGSDGNAALDRASVEAVRQSRYAPEARHGCTYPYYRTSEATIAAPVVPDKAAFKPADAQCPDEDTDWKMMPKLAFPAGFAERRIEGWAVIGYDVAPWGETGNVRVLATEPAADFGQRAREIVNAATQAASTSGRTGCIDIVRFVMPKEGQDAPGFDD
ncbi:energy transducer TonB [Sphingomonas sp. RS6]